MKSPQNLRLRLVVRRHNLPEVRVLFSISLREEPTIANLLEQVNDTVPLESPDWGLDDYAVEIEDPHHGRAFECLHFQPVETILEKDEEVIIRPLFTVDRKKRLLSGREQISSDGRHLVDGVPFGRPRLRAPRGRPPVEIPPLKRRRINFEDEEEEDGDYQEGEEGEDEDDEEEDEPLRLTQFGEDEDMEDLGAVRVAAVFDDADNGEGQDAEADENRGERLDEEELDDAEEEDEEEEEEEIDEAELLDELRDIQMDNELLGDQSLDQEHESAPARPESPEPTADSDLARLNKITALRRAFPAVDCHIYEDVLRHHNLNEEKAYKELHKSYEASMTLDQMKTLLASFSCPVLPSSNNFDAGAGDQEAESDAESTSSLVKRYDQHGFPSGSILDGSASRVAAEALRKAGHAVKSPVHVRFDDDSAENRSPEKRKLKGIAAAREQAESDSSELSDSDSDEESFKEASQEEGSESDSHSDSDSSEDENSDDSDDSDDSDESGDSDKDSGPEVLSFKGTRKSPASQDTGQRDPAAESSPSKKRKRGPGAQDAVVQEASSSDDSSDDSSDSSSESDESSSEESSDEASKQLPTPSTTKARIKSAPLPPTVTRKQPQQEPVAAAKRSAPGEGLSKTKLRNARRKLALKAKKAAVAAAAGTSASPAATASVGEVTTQTVQADDGEFLKRKQALLEKLANNNREPASSEPSDLPTTLQADTIMNGTEIASAQAAPEQQLATDGAAENSSQRRSRLDVGAGRRMLFASLGLRNPKTKADEDKIRGDLMKGVRPLVNHRITETPAAENGKTPEAEHAPAEPEEDEDDAEAWRSRINYRAVECVQEGIELSEPPFPFVQRWDPQQQNAWRDRRGGKGKRKQRNQTEFYEDDSTLPSAKKQRVNHVGHVHAFADESFGPDNSFAPETNGTQHEEAELNYDDIPEVVSNKHATEQVSQMTDVDDLPSIPKDLTRLSPLPLDGAKPGMVITWKQMAFSKATNWAPQVLDLTAVIVSIDAASEELRVVLARRDRELDGKEKTFDEEGNRVYDRFDAPDDDEDDDTESNTEGYRTIQYSDMTDPRIVQQPLPSLETTALPTIIESQNQADTVMTDSDRPAGDALSKEPPNDSAEDSTTLSNHQDSSRNKHEEHAEASIRDQHDGPDEESYGSVIPDSVPNVPNPRIKEPADATMEGLENEPADVSITDERLHDISAMIHEAGFRSDLTPSITKETRFTIEDLSSPSRQLSEQMSEAAAAANASRKGSEPPAQAQSASSPTALHEVAIPDGPVDEPSSPLKEQDTPRAETAREATPTVIYPQLPALPSSASSVRSGRQPDNEFSMDWEDDDIMQRSEDLGEDLPVVDGSHVDTTINDATPTKPKAPAQDTDASSPDPFASSPLPTLEEIFSTASQTRSTQSPEMTRPSAALQSRMPGAKRDLEYEEMMRRIDDSELGWEDDQAQVKKDVVSNQPPNSSVDWDEKLGHIKQERYSQSVSEAKNKKASLTKLASLRKVVSPPSTSQPNSKSIKAMKQEYASSQSQPLSQPRKRRTTAPPAKFSIPEGSQVVTLTSSPEPEVEEHYAEDSIDSTYEGSEAADSDLPDGGGWVRKAVPGKGKAKGKGKASGEAARRRGASLFALPAGRENAAGGKRPSSSAMILPVKPGRARRKASARF